MNKNKKNKNKNKNKFITNYTISNIINGLHVYKVNSLYSTWLAPEPKAVGFKLEQRYHR